MKKLINAPLALALAAGLAAPVLAMDVVHAGSSHSAGVATTPTLPSAPVPAVGAESQLVYSAITPCRLLDTRQPSARSGALVAREERDFLVYDADLAAEQGGAEGGCDLPAEARAVSINLTAVRPVSAGYLTAWAYGETRPLASNLNLIPNEVLSNEITVAVNTDEADPDLMIYAHVQTDLVADVVGYWTTPALPTITCTEVVSGLGEVLANSSGNVATPSCPADSQIMSASCLSYSWNGRVVTSRVENELAFCAYANEGDVPMQIQARAQCCRIAAP